MIIFKEIIKKNLALSKFINKINDSNIELIRDNIAVALIKNYSKLSYKDKMSNNDFIKSYFSSTIKESIIKTIEEN